MQEQVTKRDEARDSGDLRDEGYAGQKLLVERLQNIVDSANKYKALVSRNHLKEEIESYERQMKQFDQHYLQGDKQVLA